MESEYMLSSSRPPPGGWWVEMISFVTSQNVLEIPWNYGINHAPRVVRVVDDFGRPYGSTPVPDQYILFTGGESTRRLGTPYINPAFPPSPRLSFVRERAVGNSA
jgi:hypothetical protein